MTLLSRNACRSPIYGPSISYSSAFSSELQGIFESRIELVRDIGRSWFGVVATNVTVEPPLPPLSRPTHK